RPAWVRGGKWGKGESPDRPASASASTSPSAPGAAVPVSFRWKAHPVMLRSRVTANERPRTFAIIADGLGVHAARAFPTRPASDGRSSIVVSHETQVGPLPWLGRIYLAPRL